ncbi:MAG TPA: sulfotransferase [Planctomycetes bacterium]|nr:sulfotransferase [Planctomycetota bacterium]
MKRIPWYQGRLWHGMDLLGWLRLLVRNRFAVSPSRWPLAASITLASAVNRLLRSVQHSRFGQRVGQVQITPDPVFIIGHWRTGTTMLHELLALDPGHRPPTTYESLVPNHFLLTGDWLPRRLWFVLPRRRPMDNMRMSFDRPQEDEAALCLRGTPSPFATVAFPNRPTQYARYGDLESLTSHQRTRWQRDFRRYLQELLFRRPGRLVLKSPQHTFRLKTLVQMFPDALFIYMVRNPYVVFPSTVHFWTTMYTFHGLQRPTLKSLRQDVLDTFLAMHEKFEQTRCLISPERLYVLRYEQLVADPVGQLRAIYDHFEWDGFQGIEPAARRYADRSRRYQTNRYELEPAERAEITRRWAPYIDQYDYR